MSKMNLTPAELEELGCTPAKGLVLQAREERRQRKAWLARLAADLKKLRAEADRKEDAKRRSMTVRATAVPTEDDDAAVVWTGAGQGFRFGRVIIPRGGLWFIRRATFDALDGCWGNCVEALRERRLVVLADGIADGDLVRALRRAVESEEQDCGQRSPFQDELTPKQVEELVAEVVRTTGSHARGTPEYDWGREQLQRWLAAADGTEQAGLIRKRLVSMYGANALPEVA